MLLNVSLGPSGGEDAKANDISLSSSIHSMRGLIYFFFVSINSFTIFLFTIYYFTTEKTEIFSVHLCFTPFTLWLIIFIL